MWKKIASVLLVLTLMFGMTMNTAMAAKSSRGSYSGGKSSYSSSSSFSSGSKTYSSGVRTPSSSVKRPSSSYNNSYSTSRSSSGWGKFFGGMAVGGLLGSMFHPFGGGGYYGGGYGHGFSFFGFLFDLLLIYIVYRIVRGLFFRR